MNYDSPSAISAFLREKQITLKKRWGQNFLVSKSAREKILRSLDPATGELIWEIGPGLGAMTGAILDKGARLIGFEIDRGMINCLSDIYSDSKNLIIIQGDFVKTADASVRDYGIPDRVFGNLPYSSASKIILYFLEKKLNPLSLVFTVQKELALRITSSPSNKNYSSFSVICQFAFRTENLGDLAPGSFYPRPEVTSSVVRLIPIDRGLAAQHTQAFFRLVRAAFISRRKTLVNNIVKAELVSREGRDRLIEIFDRLRIAQGVRAEELSVEQFISLSHELLG
jgi:16S rRNA (adenine1518-N6/adenine1519-N6)-dimethyltransferase